jgi:hypothetical protein
VDVTSLGGEPKHRFPRSRGSVVRNPSLDQQLYNICVAPRSCHVERGVFVETGNIQVGTGVDQELSDVVVTLL